MKALSLAARWLFILCLPVLLITASLAWAVNSLWLYEYGFQKYGVRQTLANYGLELTNPEIKQIYAEFISYYNSDEPYVDLTVVRDGKPVKLLTPEETIHFRDVKGLVWLDYRVLIGTLLYTLAYTGVSLFRRKYRQLAGAVVGGSSLTLALMLALGLGTLLGFDQLFYKFHLVFFTNEFWSAEGYMLLLFPEPFFYDATLFFSLATVGLAIILGGISGSYLLLTRGKVPSLTKI